ncbi:MAG: phosphatase PAP2 family protein [Firmicutes bacterium]|nr:phosphatase PAP2 family protein [Bacillota bacterium]
MRPRPFVALEIDSLIEHAANSSLPSMHAASAFVIASAIWHTNKQLGTYAFVLASITAVSRVMVGVHFPLDIVVGALLGIAVCVASFAVTKRFWHKTQQI